MHCCILDVEQVETIGDAFTLTYTISDTATAYIVDLALKKCYYNIHNGQEICETDQLLDQSRFVKPGCGGQGKRRKKRAYVLIFLKFPECARQNPNTS